MKEFIKKLEKLTADIKKSESNIEEADEITKSLIRTLTLFSIKALVEFELEIVTKEDEKNE